MLICWMCTNKPSLHNTREHNYSYSMSSGELYVLHVRDFWIFWGFQFHVRKEEEWDGPGGGGGLTLSSCDSLGFFLFFFFLVVAVKFQSCWSVFIYMYLLSFFKHFNIPFPALIAMFCSLLIIILCKWIILNMYTVYPRTFYIQNKVF